MNEFLNMFLTEFLKYALSALASVAVAWLLAKATQAWKQLKEDRPDISYMLENIATIAVRSAEQMHLSSQILDKKEYALDVAGKWLKGQGVSVDLDVIEAAIESAVLNEFNWDKVEENKAVTGGG